MTYGEALRLVTVLAGDPSAQITAGLAGWTHPVSRVDMTLRDLYDVQLASKSKRKPKLYPRPWDEQPERTGAGTSLTVDQFRALKASITEEV